MCVRERESWSLPLQRRECGTAVTKLVSVYRAGLQHSCRSDFYDERGGRDLLLVWQSGQRVGAALFLGFGPDKHRLSVDKAGD